MLNAFWRVAPSDRLRLFAMLPARLFFFAIDFNVRSSAAVHARLFFLFFIFSLPVCSIGCSAIPIEWKARADYAATGFESQISV